MSKQLLELFVGTSIELKILTKVLISYTWVQSLNRITSDLNYLLQLYFISIYFLFYFQLQILFACYSSEIKLRLKIQTWFLLTCGCLWLDSTNFYFRDLSYFKFMLYCIFCIIFNYFSEVNFIFAWFYLLP